MDAYARSECKEILDFDIQLIDRLEELEETAENCKKVLLDLYAIRHDLEIVRDFINQKE